MPIKRTSTICLTLVALIATLDAENSTASSLVTKGPVNHSGDALVDFNSPNFVGSGKCFPCHTLLTDSSGADMSITKHWRSTMMANASKDPLWQAKVASEVFRNPQIKDVIEKKCVTCHMPMAWTQKNADASPSSQEYKGGDSIFENFLDKSTPYHEAAMDGVSCSFCHQIEDKNMGQTSSFSGNFSVNTEWKAPDRQIYGPYKTTEQKTMRDSVGFTPTYSSHMNDSGLCATCHTLFTPFLNDKNEVGGHFPEQTVFLEWQQSSYAGEPGMRHDIDQDIPGVRICQECHMPHNEAGNVVIAKYAPPGTGVQDHFSRHFFVGGNSLMLTLLQANMNSIRPTAPYSYLEDTKKRTLDLLQNKTAQLTISKADKGSEILDLELNINNLVGHKYPSGFPSRRTWIHLQVSDGSGTVFFDSGRPQENGSVMGDDADQNRGSFEPHYELITNDSQVQIYEAVMGDTSGKQTHTLLRAAQYLKDNRLLPDGFNKHNVASEIGVYGRALTDDNFQGGSDRINYHIALQNHSGPFQVSATLYYTTVSYNFIQDLFLDDHLEKVAKLRYYWSRTDKSPVPVSTTSATVR